jgi:hypothetical protein
MHAIIDGFCFIIGIAAFILCFVKLQKESFPYYCPIPIAWIILYPILIELIYNALTCIPGRI